MKPQTVFASSPILAAQGQSDAPRAEQDTNRVAAFCLRGHPGGSVSARLDRDLRWEAMRQRTARKN